MRKILACLCAAFVTLSLAGCPGPSAKTNNPTSAQDLRADPSKMPPEARKKMEEAQRRAGRR